MCLSSPESLLSATAEIIVQMHSPVIAHRTVAAKNILLYLLEEGTARSRQLQHFASLAFHDLLGVGPLHLPNTGRLLRSTPFKMLSASQGGTGHDGKC
jgi:hypothetical protein